MYIAELIERAVCAIIDDVVDGAHETQVMSAPIRIVADGRSLEIKDITLEDEGVIVIELESVRD
jgi:hypothetical protein